MLSAFLVAFYKSWGAILALFWHPFGSLFAGLRGAAVDNNAGYHEPQEGRPESEKNNEGFGPHAWTLRQSTELQAAFGFLFSLLNPDVVRW